MEREYFNKNTYHLGLVIITQPLFVSLSERFGCSREKKETKNFENRSIKVAQ